MPRKAQQPPATRDERQKLTDTVFKALEYTADAVLILGIGGTIYYYNKAWLAVHAFDGNEDFRGRNIRDVERKEILPLVDDAEKAVLKGRFFTRQFGTVRGDGKYHDIYVAANLVRDIDPPLVVVILREVTDLVQTQKKLERRNRELSILNEMHGIIISAKSRRAVVRRILKLLGEYIGADAMGMYRADCKKAHAVLIESIGVPQRLKKTVARVPLKAITFAVLGTPRTYVVEQDMPGYKGGEADIRQKLGVKRTVGFVFRTGSREEHVAFFGLKRNEDIGPEVRTFLETVGNQFGIAIERVELLDALKNREKELQGLTGRLVSSGEEEKRQCSRMLHDDVGQTLTGLRLEIDMLEKNLSSISPCTRKSFEAMRAQIKFIADTTRTLSKSLHPAMLEDLGLVPTLNWYIDNFVRSDTFCVELEEAGFDEDPPLPASLTLYRVAQECLTNVIRHARASRAIIKLTKGYPHVIMVIEDNGRGISEKKAKAKEQGLGLVSMRERVEYMGGTFRFTSVPGKGTRVRVTIPIEAKHVR